jgi:hypothetical protein
MHYAAIVCKTVFCLKTLTKINNTAKVVENCLRLKTLTIINNAA